MVGIVNVNLTNKIRTKNIPKFCVKVVNKIISPLKLQISVNNLNLLEKKGFIKAKFASLF